MRSLEGFTDPFLAEIAGQPDALRRAAAALVDQRDELDRVREAAASSHTIVFTGMGDEELAARFIAAGANGYVDKRNLKRLADAARQAIRIEPR